jgi:dTDP-4-dehydrorhamnose 3,5-epimerase
MIEGVQTKKLVRHPNGRGYFQEIIRETDPFFDGFGQWSLSSNDKDTFTEEFHCHNIQTDYFFVSTGIIKVVLYDMRSDSLTYMQTDTYILGDVDNPFVLKIPPGVAHGLKVIEGPAHLNYITSHAYNPLDEGRVLIDYDWSK